MKTKTEKQQSRPRLTRAERRLLRLNALFCAKRANACKDFEVICRRLDKNNPPSELCRTLKNEKGESLYAELCSLVSLRLRYKRNCSNDAAVVALAKKLDLYPHKELCEKAETDEERARAIERTKKTFKKFARRAKLRAKKNPVQNYAQMLFARNAEVFNIKPPVVRRSRTMPKNFEVKFFAAKR